MKAPNTIMAAPTSVSTIRITVPAVFLVGVVVPIIVSHLHRGDTR